MSPKLEIAILAGAESKVWLAEFTKQVDRLEKLSKKTVKAVSTETETEEETTTDDEAEFFAAPKKTSKKAAATKTKTTKAASQMSFFDDENANEEETEDVEEKKWDDETNDETEDEETVEPVVAKTAKAKKITIDDINDACKNFAKENGGGKEGRTAVLKLLKKNFKTESISALEPSDYAKALKLLNS